MSARLALARIGRRPRLAAAAVCLLLAAGTALHDLGGTAAAPSSGRAVVVVVRDLPVGHVLGAHDLRTARWPSALAPPGAMRAAHLATGRVLAGPMAGGEPVTPRRLVDPGLTAGLGDDTVALPVDVDTDVHGFVPPGGRVDLLTVPRPDALAPGDTSTGAELVARGVRVLAVLPAPAASVDGAAGEVGSRLVVAVRRDQAVRLAGLRPTRAFTALAASP